MRPITATVGPLTAQSANNIALSQTPGAAGPLTLNGSLVSGGVAVIGNPQRITLTTTDNTHSFTITGATPTGSLLTETVTGNGTSATSLLDYAKVSSITISGAASAAVTVGTSGTGSTPWVRLDEWANPQVSIQCDVTGTVSYTVQSTNDDPNSPTDPVSVSAMTWITTNDTNAVNATASVQTNYLFAPTFVRALLNSGSGSVAMKVIQYNVASR
jgi:hypothetical protein